MSAVDDVDMRLCRLEEAYQLTQTQLLELSTQRQYDPTRGVDVDYNGGSVATLEIAVLAARNMAFQSGFLMGNGAYVRATLDPPGAALDLTPKCTQQRAIATSPCWQETLVIQGMTQLHSRLVVEVLQEERVGADRVVGVVVLDVSALHDQRPTEKWHTLVTRDNQPTMGQLYLGCRLNRSVIFQLELESELLQNQIRELRDFVARQRCHEPRAASSRSALLKRTPSDQSLDGKEVSAAILEPTITPPSRRPRPLNARLEAMHSPVIAVRKRERRPSSGPQTQTQILQSPMSTVVSMDLQQPRIKRRKLEPVTETHVESLSARLANWLLPTAPQTKAQTQAQTQQALAQPPPTKAHWGSGGGEISTAPVVVSPIRRRGPGGSLHHQHSINKKKKKSTALAALEQWLFRDPSTTATTTVDRVHAQMQAER